MGFRGLPEFVGLGEIARVEGCPGGSGGHEASMGRGNGGAAVGLDKGEGAM